MTLKQADLTYTATPDLRERYRPGQKLRCVLTEYDPYRQLMNISVKAATVNPFQGAIMRHPRQQQTAGHDQRQVWRRRILHPAG